MAAEKYPRDVYHNTARGLDFNKRGSYPFALGFASREDFLRWIDGNTVLDMGSGYGTMAKEVEMEKLNKHVSPKTKIISLNPSLQEKWFRKIVERGNEHKKDEKNVTIYPGGGIYQGTRAELKLKGRRLPKYLNDAHDRSAISADWKNTGLPDASVDKIVANFSFPMYSKNLEEVRAVADELSRIIKVGGEARFFPANAHDINILNMTFRENSAEFVKFFTDMLEAYGFSTSEALIPPSEDTQKYIASLPEEERKNVKPPFCLIATKTAEVHPDEDE